MESRLKLHLSNPLKWSLFLKRLSDPRKTAEAWRQNVAESIKWGVLGNSTIGRKCMIPAIGKSRNGAVYALGTRRPDQVERMASEHRIEAVYESGRGRGAFLGTEVDRGCSTE